MNNNSFTINRKQPQTQIIAPQVTHPHTHTHRHMHTNTNQLMPYMVKATVHNSMTIERTVVRYVCLLQLFVFVWFPAAK